MCVQGQIVETAVGEAVSVVYEVSVVSLEPIKKTRCELHFAFFILAMRLAFASVEMHL